MKTLRKVKNSLKKLFLTLEDIVFRYGDTVYINKCRDLPKFSNCIDQSIISGGMRERRRYRGEGEEKEGEEEGEEAKEEARMKVRETQSGLAPPSLFIGDPLCGRRGSIASSLHMHQSPH